MLRHSRRTSNGQSMSTWLLQSGPVYLKRFVRNPKFKPLVTKVDLIESNTEFALIRYPDGRESTVSTRYLAPTENFKQLF